MKRISLWSPAALAAVVIACSVSVANASTLYWWTTSGSGKWSSDTGTLYNHWSDTEGTVGTTAWTQGSDAFFTCGTPNSSFYVNLVNAASDVQVGNITCDNVGKVNYKIGGTDSTLNLYGDSSNTSTFNVGGSSSSAVDSMTVQVIVAGSANLTKTGIGKLQFDKANTYTGTTNLQAGTLVLNNALALQYSTLNFTGGALSFNGMTAATLGGLSGSKTITGTVAAGGVALTVGGNNANTQYSGVYKGDGASLTKVGSGKLTLTGVNLYTGATTISDGILALASNGSIATSATIDIAAGATLSVTGVTGGFSLASGQTLQGNGSVSGDVTVASGATLAPGNSIGVLTFDSNVTLADGSTTLMEIGASSSDLVSVGDTLTLGGTLKVTDDGTVSYAAGQSWDLFDAVTFSGSFSTYDLPTLTAGLTWNTSTVGTTGVLSVAAVPEPATAAMLLGGLLGLIAYAWRKRK